MLRGSRNFNVVFLIFTIFVAGTNLYAVCGSANNKIQHDVEVLQWSSGASAGTNIKSLNPRVNGKKSGYRVLDHPFYEGMRFDLKAPAKIIGFSVKWDSKSALPFQKLKAGLYRDFGHNGFHFWHKKPLWEGTRCSQDVIPGKWVDYILDRPVDIPNPEYIFVAHHVKRKSAPVWQMDSNAKCKNWNNCPAVVHLPTVETRRLYQGAVKRLSRKYQIKLYVKYRHKNSKKYFKRSMPAISSHVNWGDYNHDGFDDLLIDGPKLYKNLGGLGFSDVTEKAGLSGIKASGGSWADYNGDSCLDLFLFNEKDTVPNRLYKSNCDGTFKDVSDASGIALTAHQKRFCKLGKFTKSRSGAWLDYNADGNIDLYVTNGLCIKGAYFDDALYRNNGNGTFTEVSKEVGIAGFGMPGRSAIPIDFDSDGDIDIQVTSYKMERNLLFENIGGTRFKEIGRDLNLAGVAPKYRGHTISAGWSDLDGDGDWDNIQANLAHPRYYKASNKTQILLQKADGKFESSMSDWTGLENRAGLRFQEIHAVPLISDFNLDGVPDLILTSGRERRTQDFYWGKGDGSFKIDTYFAGIDVGRSFYGAGISSSDYDNDGDVDFYANGVNTYNGPISGNFVSIKVVGEKRVNTAAIGTVVRVYAGGKLYLRQVEGASGKGGQNSLYLHFGLGDAKVISKIKLSFPGGQTKVFKGPFPTNTRLWLTESGKVTEGWRP
ncbi:MAG: CRTAC1 family protein [Bacteriovoracaceae bacterium]|jgi:enediyne biosynthesis protein E4|nr:CRTAC1 family protein [Bacteriovoracaceae bacterium]